MERYVDEFGRSFAVLETLGDDAQGQRLDQRDGFVAILAVGRGLLGDAAPYFRRIPGATVCNVTSYQSPTDGSLGYELNQGQ